MLAHQHGDRKDFLACGTARHPDPHRVACAPPLEQSRNDQLRQLVEGVGVAEEVGDVDQQVMEERADFVGILFEALKIGVQRRQLHHLHAAVNTPHEGARLVAFEIVADLAA